MEGDDPPFHSGDSFGRWGHSCAPLVASRHCAQPLKHESSRMKGFHRLGAHSQKQSVQSQRPSFQASEHRSLFLPQKMLKAASKDLAHPLHDPPRPKQNASSVKPEPARATKKNKYRGGGWEVRAPAVRGAAKATSPTPKMRFRTRISQAPMAPRPRGRPHPRSVHSAGCFGAYPVTPVW